MNFLMLFLLKKDQKEYSNESELSDLVNKALENKEFNNAYNLLNKGIHEYPDIAAFWYNKGILESDIFNKFQEAISSFNKAIEKKYHKLADCWHYIGKSYSNLKKTTEALEAYKKAIASNSEHLSKIYHSISLILVTLNQNDEALENINKAIKANKDESEAAQLLLTKSYIYIVKEEYESALELIDNIENEYEDKIRRLHYFRGLCLLNLDKDDESIESFKKEICNYPDAAAFNNLSGLYGKKNEYEKALRSSIKATTLDPNNEIYWLNRGISEFLLKEYEDAIVSNKKCLELNSKLTHAYINLAACYDRIGQSQEAINLTLKAIKIDPNENEFKRNLIIFYLKINEYDKASDLVDEYLKYDKKNANVWNNKGLILRHKNKLNEAYNCFKIASEIVDNSDDIGGNFIHYGNMAEIDLTNGNYKYSLNHIKKSIEIYDKSAQNWDIYAQLMLQLKEYEKSECYFDKAIKIDKNEITYQINKGVALYRKYLYKENEENLKENLSLLIVYFKNIINRFQYLDKNSKNKNITNIFFNLGILHLKLGNYVNSINCLETAIKRDRYKDKYKVKFTNYVFSKYASNSIFDWWLFRTHLIPIRSLMFILLSICIILLVFFPGIYLVTWNFYSEISEIKFINFDWKLYLILISFFLFILFYPSFYSIKVAGIEINKINKRDIDLNVLDLNLESAINNVNDPYFHNSEDLPTSPSP